MNSPSKPLILYGVPFSQPVRAVMWLLLYKRMPFEMVLINPGSKGDTGSRNPAYLAKNSGGTIPTIEEPDTGFTLGEAHAILCYLCNRHGWDDVYPADARLRAKVDWYLHFHHRNVREASTGIVAPKIRKDLDIPEATQQAARATLTRALDSLETGWLAQSAYLAGAQLTLADFAAYVEIGQLQPEFTNLFYFAPYPNVRRWLDAMKRVEGHDAVHVALAELGDISVAPPEIEAIRSANKRALGVLKERLAQFAP
ncbi:MAG: glutathione S-transferase family protein [Betaproteobacteria bacterium]